MKVLFYASGDNDACLALEREMESLVPKRNREVCRTIETLTLRLRRPTHNLLLALLFTATRRELTSMLSIRDLLSDLRIVLILPDRGKKAVAKGHILRPRFLSYADSDFSDVRAVMAKMIGDAFTRARTGVGPVEG